MPNGINARFRRWFEAMFRSGLSMVDERLLPVGVVRQLRPQDFSVYPFRVRNPKTGGRQLEHLAFDRSCRTPSR